jgi:radical SAM enzyme (TIGR01210 family)
MSKFPEFTIDSKWISTQRGKKNLVDPYRPCGYFVEAEYAGPGLVEDVSTILLTNRECPFRCLMCDLWKNTTHEPVPTGAIPEQIRFAISRLPHSRHLKLYNSGSFFDPRAIPVEDHQAIARLVKTFETVIVESHPFFVGENTLVFNDLLKPALQVAVGLETVHPEILPRLHKKMDLTHFEKSIRFLNENGIPSRAFILLRPPFLSEAEGVEWAKRSIDYAFSVGVTTCIIIPVRSGNGALEALAADGCFAEPLISSLEHVLEYGIGLGSGPVFADLWDIERFSSCDRCLEPRRNRLVQMNLEQRFFLAVRCSCTT